MGRRVSCGGILLERGIIYESGDGTLRMEVRMCQLSARFYI